MGFKVRVRTRRYEFRPGHQPRGVPHISLVYREMWDTTELNWHFWRGEECRSADDSANRNARKTNLYRCEPNLSTARGVSCIGWTHIRRRKGGLFRLFRLFRNRLEADPRYASRRITPRSRHSVPARAARTAAHTANTTFTAHEGATPTRCSRKGRKFQVVMCW
jgi:hypothetical protein